MAAELICIKLLFMIPDWWGRPEGFLPTFLRLVSFLIVIPCIVGFKYRCRTFFCPMWRMRFLRRKQRDLFVMKRVLVSVQILSLCFGHSESFSSLVCLGQKRVSWRLFILPSILPTNTYTNTYLKRSLEMKDYCAHAYSLTSIPVKQGGNRSNF